jgi:hypothetical protein
MIMDDFDDDYSSGDASDSSSADDSMSDDNSTTDWNSMDPPEDNDEKLEEYLEHTGDALPFPQTLEVNGEYVTVNYGGTLTNASGTPIGYIDQQDVGSIQYDDPRLKEAVEKSNGTSSSSSSGNSGEGCYIATAVYGSYDADEVLVLRQFRDGYLLRRDWGKKFVRLYYQYSPKLARKLKNITVLNRPVKAALNLLVRRLRKK